MRTSSLLSSLTRMKKTTRSLICNYTDVTEDLEINSKYPNLYAKYKYEPCGHVITGDLNIVNDRESIAIPKKGPQYHPAAKINWTECYDV